MACANRSNFIGFIIKSNVSSSKLSTACSGCAVIKIHTGTSNAFFLKSRPLSPGMSMSKKRISTFSFSIVGSASCADEKVPKIFKIGNLFA